MGSSNGKRVLKFVLTDGKTEISALEYSHIPSINNMVSPGTKVLHINLIPFQNLYVFHAFVGCVMEILTPLYC